MIRSRRLMAAVAALACATSLAACTSQGTPASTPVDPPKTVTIVTHDSFELDEELLSAFENDTGFEIEHVQPGNAGAMVNQLVLTKDSPLGDVVFGIDNTFAGRAITEGVLAPYAAKALPADAADLKADDQGLLTPVDFGDVCLNADLGWFKEKGLAVPRTLDDLVKPEYKGLLVVENPASSSPGLAFLAATVGAKGEPGYLDYWRALEANDVKVVKGWTEAYSVEFSGSAGKGSRPLVVSYATSPAFEVSDGKAPTTALLDTCFRQVEYAGVLAGAENPQGAQAFIEFLLSPAVQASIPDSMYMYPAVRDTELPPEWVEFAPLAEDPIDVPAATIAERREAWVKDWTATVLG